MGSPLLDRYHFYFLMILKETLTFLSLSNAVLQYTVRVEFALTLRGYEVICDQW